jgi:lipopolysaccharide assembly outer membrane protein LptD (OstA)
MTKFNKYPIFVLLFLAAFSFICLAQEDSDKQPASGSAPMPIVVNGDKVEFFTDLQMVVGEGNVKIEYGTSVLTCDKITVYTKSKDVMAEGHVKLKDEKGIIEGENAFYNFDTKLGKIIQATVKTDPYFAVAPEVEKSPAKFILYNGDITTCNLDKPHYYIHARKIEIIPDDKIKAKNVKFRVGDRTLLYLPFFNQSIKDRKEGFSFEPGMSKEWGSYLLTRYTYYLRDDLRGTMHFDWYTNKGAGGGMDLQLISSDFGNGLLKYYQINESLHGKGEVEPIFKDHKRYKTQYRHKWDSQDSKDHFVMQINDYSDADFLKKYFYREYEKDAQATSYILASHNYDNATLSFMLEKRLNQFYSETERLPEIKLETVDFKIMDTPFYYQNQSSIVNYNSKTAYTDADEDTVRLDTYNEFTCPFKFAFLENSPYIGTRYTYYSKDKNGSEKLFRNVFYTGYDVLTKFYRIFDVKTDKYGLEIDRLRHVITPSIKYAYIHQPTLPANRLTAFDSVDSITKQNTATLSLENKLQTKRDGINSDFLTLIVDSPYYFKLEEHGGRFEVINFDLEIFPNSWLEFWSDAQFNLRRRAFDTANFDVEFPLKNDNNKEIGKVSTGYRYATSTNDTDPDSEIFTFSFERNLNPKWKIRTYHRLDLAIGDPIEEQEYALVRDLHCWEMEFVVNNKKKKGTSFWFALRMKVFSDVGFEFDKTHQAPKTR